MKLIRPVSRQLLTEYDMDFITGALSRNENESVYLRELLDDDDMLDLILDNGELFATVLDRPEKLRISKELYFYILVRHELLRLNVNDRQLADYVAEMLASFARGASVSRPLPWDQFEREYMADLMAAVPGAPLETRFFLQAHLGNYALYLLGVFPDRIVYREKHRGSPGVAHYLGLGQDSFRAASRLHLAGEYELNEVFEGLAEHLPAVASAVSTLSDQRLFAGLPLFKYEMLVVS